MFGGGFVLFGFFLFFFLLKKAASNWDWCEQEETDLCSFKDGGTNHLFRNEK